MRTLLLITSLLLASYPKADCQIKADYHWFFGYDYDKKEPFKAVMFDFNNSDGNILGSLDKGLEMDNMSASIADENGELLFYTNGCAVANRKHEVMPHGDSLNWGIFLELFWSSDCSGGYPGRQDILILPNPANDAGYYIIHYITDILEPDFEIKFRPLYSYVDMQLDGGLGDLSLSNQPLQDSTFVLSGYLTAIHHHNGRDWWVLSPIQDQNMYLRTLIDSQGMHVDTLVIGEAFHWNASASGFARFSPDGTRYAYYNENDHLRLYDFDRTTGQLSNEVNVRVNNPSDDIIFAGIEWSPNSRFIYVADELQVWQVDTWEADIQNNGIRKIAEWDGTLNPLPTTFTELAMGPDCRIYLRPKNGIASWHVMYEPDALGEACSLVQNAIQFPPEQFAANGCMPNFPRFRVDADQPCDPSIRTALDPLTFDTRQLSAFPNPAVDFVQVDIPEAGRLLLRDMQGRPWFDQEVQAPTNQRIDLHHVPPGTYQVSLWAEGKQVVYVTGVSVVR